MSNIKNKVAVTASEILAKKTADAAKGNSELQIKEEPSNIDEYLKSSEAFVQVHAKVPCSVGIGKSATPGRVVPSQVSAPAAGVSSTPKITTTATATTVRLSSTGQQGTKNTMAASKMASSQSLVKASASVAKSSDSLSDKPKTPLSSVAVAVKVTPANQKSVSQKANVVSSKAADEAISRGNTVNVGSDSKLMPLLSNVKAAVAGPKQTPVATGLRKNVTVAETKCPSALSTKVVTSTPGPKDTSSVNAPRKVVTSSAQKDVHSKEVLKTPATSTPNVKTNPALATQKGAMVTSSAKPAANSMPSKGHVVQNKLPDTKGPMATKPVPAVVKSLSSRVAPSELVKRVSKMPPVETTAADMSCQNVASIPNRLPQKDLSEIASHSDSTCVIGASKGSTMTSGTTDLGGNQSFAEVTIKTEPPNSDDTAPTPKQPESTFCHTAVYSLPHEEQVPSIAQQNLDIPCVQTEMSCTDVGVSDTLQASLFSLQSSILDTDSTTLAISCTGVVTPVSPGTNIVSGVNGSDANPIVSNIDLSLVKTEPMDEECVVEPVPVKTASAHPDATSAAEGIGSVANTEAGSFQNVLSEETSAVENTLHVLHSSGENGDTVPADSGDVPVLPIPAADLPSFNSVADVNDILMDTVVPEAVNLPEIDAVLRGDVSNDVSISTVPLLSNFAIQSETERSPDTRVGYLCDEDYVTDEAVISTSDFPNDFIGMGYPCYEDNIIDESVINAGDFQNDFIRMGYPCYEDNIIDEAVISTSDFPNYLTVAEAGITAATVTQDVTVEAVSIADVEMLPILSACVTSKPRVILPQEKQTEVIIHQTPLAHKMRSGPLDATDRHASGVGNVQDDQRIGSNPFCHLKPSYLSLSSAKNDSGKRKKCSDKSCTKADDEYHKTDYSYLEEMKKRMARQKRKAEKSTEEDNSKQSDHSVVKRPRLCSPGIAKENTSATYFASAQKSATYRSLRQKVLISSASHNQEKRNSHQKKPIGKVSDDLWMETSSFLDEDLRSESESRDADFIFEPKVLKQRMGTRTRRKLHGSSKSSRSLTKPAGHSRHCRRKPSQRYSKFHTSLPFLSDFVTLSLSRNVSWDLASCEVEDILASRRQDLLSDLNSVCLGKQPRFLLQFMGHLGNLSLETQLESQLCDVRSVKSIFIEVARDWVRRKPLHMFMNGQMKLEKKMYLPPKRVSRTNATSEECQRVFSHDICHILATTCNLGESEDGLYDLPDGLSQFTANRVFRKVKQYLRNYVGRLRRLASVEREQPVHPRMLRESKRSTGRKTRLRQKAQHVHYERQPSLEAVIQLHEPSTLSQTGSCNEVTQPSGKSVEGAEKLLPVPARMTSLELSEPVQNSLTAAYDLFCREAENICQEAAETGEELQAGVDDVLHGDIDSSRLYSPTSPTAVEEQEIDVDTVVTKARTPTDSVVMVEETAVPVIMEKAAVGDKSGSSPREIVDKHVAVSDGDASTSEQPLLPVGTVQQDLEEGEIEICINQEESIANSDTEVNVEPKKLRSFIEVRHDSQAAEKLHESSLKRKKRSKLSKEKKAKRRKDKHRSESFPSPERDKWKKKKKYKHTSAAKNEGRHVSRHSEVLESLKTEKVRQCTASKSDVLYLDSYASVVEDVLSLTPVSNFKDSFDPLLPPSGHYRNPFRLTWSLLECFISSNKDILSKLVGVIPNVDHFNVRVLKPRTSFLWSLVLALYDKDLPKKGSANAVNRTKGICQSALNSKPSEEEPMEMSSSIDDVTKKTSVKGNNPLMQAFRQVVEAKRRMSKESQKGKPFSSITKLSAELAARRAAPKSAKPLYKPMQAAEASVPLQNSESVDTTSSANGDQMAHLLREVMFHFYEEMKIVLDELDFTSSCEWLSVTSDLPNFDFSLENIHLDALSSWVSSLYDNYESLSQAADNWTVSVSEADECVIVSDNNGNTLPEFGKGDFIVSQSAETAHSDDLTLEGTTNEIAPMKDLEKSGDATEEVTLPVSCPTSDSNPEADVAVAEEEMNKPKNIGVEITEPTVSISDRDRQYISSFPPVGVSKKKVKVPSQVPRMIFSKLIGPALERLGTTSVSSMSSPSVTGQTPSSAEILASDESQNTPAPVPVVQSLSMVAASLETVSVATVSESVSNSEMKQTSPAKVAVSLASDVENISLPFNGQTTLASGDLYAEINKPGVKKVAENLVQNPLDEPDLSLGSSASGISSSASLAKNSDSIIRVEATISVPVSSAAADVHNSATFVSISSSAPQISRSVEPSPSIPAPPPIPADQPAPGHQGTRPPLPPSQADMVPPPMPPGTLAPAVTTASSALDSSVYYQNCYPDQSQVYASSSYLGYMGPPSESLVSPWMYDPSLQYANQVPILDASMMSYPPPLPADQVPFFMPPTNQPPPFYPQPPTVQLFPAYASSQPATSFSVPPPTIHPMSVPPPSIPLSVPPPPIMNPSVPPPTIFTTPDALQTSVPQPPYNSFGMQWTQETPGNSVPLLSSNQVVGSSPLPLPSSTVPPPVSGPPPALESQQGPPFLDSFQSIKDLVKFPPPLASGYKAPDLPTQGQSMAPTEFPPEQEKTRNFPGHSGNASDYPPAQSNDAHDAGGSLRNKPQNNDPVGSKYKGSGNPTGNWKQHSSTTDRGDRQLTFETDADNSYANKTNQEALGSSKPREDYVSGNQTWQPNDQRDENISDLWTSDCQNMDGSRPLLSKKLASESAQPSLQLQSGLLSAKQQVQTQNVMQDRQTKKSPLLNPDQRNLNTQAKQHVLTTPDPGPQNIQPGLRPRHPGPDQRHPGSQNIQPSLQPRHPGPDQRHSGPQNIQPSLRPRHPGPEQRLSGPQVRQTSMEPRAQLRPTISDPKLAGPPLRPPGPDMRQARPLLQAKPAGPEKRQENSGQRDHGWQMRLPSPTGPEHPLEGPLRRQPGLLPRQPNIGGPDQRPGGPQPRPSVPQMRLQRPAGQEKGQQPVSFVGPHVIDQRPRGSMQRMIGPPGDGPQDGLGQRGVLPGKIRPQEEPLIKALMDLPIRRQSDEPVSNAVTQPQPVRPGYPLAQGPLSNARFYVFNVDRPACRIAELILLRSGARKFDPHNINALRVMPEIRCLLLVNKEDLKHVQRIPALLRLKRDLRVSFVTFTDPQDIQQKRLITFFPRAGTMVMDLTALLACKSDVLDGICQFMAHQTLEKRTSWKLLLPSDIFNVIDFLKYRYEDDPEEHVRFAEMSQILATYKTSGVMEFLPENLYEGRPRSTFEYQACCVALQVNRLGSFRHFLFVTDMPRSHPDANLFLSNGIDILSIPEFMRCFVARHIEHQPKLHSPYIIRQTLSKYYDAVISNAAESMGI